MRAPLLTALALTLAACASSGEVAEHNPTVRTPSPASPFRSALAAGLAEARAPGAQAAVFACGKPVWSGAAGVLDAASRRPVTTTSRFVLASTTKTITATMIMRLVDDGRLRLGESLERFYPDLPNAGIITIEMLLRHRSGLSDYEDAPAIRRAVADPRHHWTRDEVLAAIDETIFDPGSDFEYSNSGFVVLGGIIERAAGTPVARAFADGIAEPLKLARSSFDDRAGDEHAHPHDDGDDLWVDGHGIASHALGPVWTDGGLSSTAHELAAIGDALFGGRLLSPPSLELMMTIDADDSGLGLERASRGGREWLGHSGSYGGFESELWHDPKRGITIAVTANMEAAGEEDSVSGVILDAIEAVEVDPCVE